MPSRERGQSPSGFRQQLLQRIRNQSLQEGIPAQRLQQRIAFERLLARLPTAGDWILKGGFALELRYGLKSRPTRDVDLRIQDHPAQALERLREVLTSSRVTDAFTFELGEIGHEMQGAPGGSLRVRIVTRLAGEVFAVFHLDLSSGDALVGRPDLLRGSNFLQFAGIERVEFPAYPVVQHLAEKLHAYTLPRERENSRVKDLVDLDIIAAVEWVDADQLKASIGATFDFRGTHAPPWHVPEPPTSWAPSFAAISATVNLPMRDLEQGHQLAAHFLDPILGDSISGQVWSPHQRRWSPPDGMSSSSSAAIHPPSDQQRDQRHPN